jgi:hypothetical protein
VQAVWAQHSAQAACRSAKDVRRAGSESHSGARREVQAVSVQHSELESVRAASHRERRAWPVARSVHAGLRRAAGVQR